MGINLDELKPNLESSLQFLDSCDNYSEQETYDTFHVLNEAALKCDDLPGLGAYMVDKRCGILFAKIWKELSAYLVKDKRESQGFLNLMEMLSSYINITDESPELCVQ